MSTLISGKSPVCKEICDALGLKHVRKLDIHMAYDKVVTIEAELFPEENGMRQLVSILKKYNLVEVKEPKQEIPLYDPGSNGPSIDPFKKDKSWLENCWLAEASYGRTAWYAKSIERNTVIGTSNAWEARRFATRDDCLDWIDSWKVPEIEKRKYAPVSHGFVHEGEAIKEKEC